EKAFRRFIVSFRRSRIVVALFGDSIDCFNSSGKSKPQPTLCDELIFPAGCPCSEYMMRKYISVLYYSKTRDLSMQWFSFREEASCSYTSRGSEIAPASYHFASLQCYCHGAVGFETSNLQALPIYLDKIFNQFVSIILSVTFVLFFGEVLDYLLGHNEALFRRAQLKALVSIRSRE
ncbi:hypothetical protein S83_047305, partial [Arachis hypogaea]